MTSPRLPAAVEVSALMRLAEASGGFAVIVRKGEPDSGTVLVVMLDNQGFGLSLGRVFERLPRPDGTRKWSLARAQDPENKQEFEAYINRRVAQDPDLWVVELTIADGERFILNLD